MKVVIQKVLESSVTVDKKIVGQIQKGFMILVGINVDDTKEDIDYLVKKIVNLRIFEDETNIMNKSLLEVQGNILSISQFTLQADTKKGNRPSYINAMKGEKAKNLYDIFNDELSKYTHVETGIFGADMKVSLINDGPTTIIIDSKNK